MAALDRWKHVEELNVYQISLLLAGYDPAPFERTSYVRWQENIIDATAPYLISLKNAVSAGRIEVCRSQYIENSDEYNWDGTLIGVKELRAWLRRRGLVDNFFVQDVKARKDYSDPWSAHYAPKLAAAVAAWEAVTSDPMRLRGKSPKKALEAWLTENAKTYELVNKDGTPNKTGIEEIAKVANWRPAGGAPKTPAPLQQTSGRVVKNQGEGKPKPRAGFVKSPDDDDIPF